MRLRPYSIGTYGSRPAPGATPFCIALSGSGISLRSDVGAAAAKPAIANAAAATVIARRASCMLVSCRSLARLGTEREWLARGTEARKSSLLVGARKTQRSKAAEESSSKISLKLGRPRASRRRAAETPCYIPNCARKRIPRRSGAFPPLSPPIRSPDVLKPPWPAAEGRDHTQRLA
ncbi:hypothetical protein FKP32DRAFT_1141226 [Trametes sanguinea]|nr:hypothetical protein FKP32DRAFT_1141226 [Trametes sanguinea]